MVRFEFYKELYFKQIDRKISLESSLNTPISLTSIVVGALFYFLFNYDFSIDFFQNFLFIFIILISFILIGISVHNLIMSYNNFKNGYDYEYLPYSLETEKYYDELVNYYKDPNVKAEGSAEIDFENFLIDKMNKYHDINAYNNDVKSSYLFKAKKFLVLSLILTVFSTGIFSFNYIYKVGKEKIYKIEVNKPIELKDSIDK